MHSCLIGFSGGDHFHAIPCLFAPFIRRHAEVPPFTDCDVATSSTFSMRVIAVGSVFLRGLDFPQFLYGDDNSSMCRLYKGLRSAAIIGLMVWVVDFANSIDTLYRKLPLLWQNTKNDVIICKDVGTIRNAESPIQESIFLLP